jgi:hypothetical protein
MMPRKKECMATGAGNQATAGKAVYACNAAGNVRGLDPPSAKPLVLPSTGPSLGKSEALRYLQDVFKGQIEENVIYMVLSECDWQGNALLLTSTVATLRLFINRLAQLLFFFWLLTFVCICFVIRNDHVLLFSLVLF